MVSKIFGRDARDAFTAEQVSDSAPVQHDRLQYRLACQWVSSNVVRGNRVQTTRFQAVASFAKQLKICHVVSPTFSKRNYMVVAFRTFGVYYAIQ